jgi:Iap family predicted aminopeptidase
MPLVHQCSRQGCRVLTMGEFCIQHESAPRPVPAVAARVDMRTVAGARPVRRPLYSPSSGNGQA